MRYGNLRVGSSVAGRLREGRPVRFRSRRLPAVFPLGQRAIQHVALEGFKPAARAVVAGTDLDLRRPAKLAFGGALVPAPNRHQRDGKFLGDLRVGNEACKDLVFQLRLLLRWSRVRTVVTTFGPPLPSEKKQPRAPDPGDSRHLILAASALNGNQVIVTHRP